MQEATVADSFIREVLRMKGDSVNLVRAAIRDVELGAYLIPKGICFWPETHTVAVNLIFSQALYCYPSLICLTGRRNSPRNLTNLIRSVGLEVGNPLQQRGQDTSLLALAGGPAQVATLPCLVCIHFTT